MRIEDLEFHSPETLEEALNLAGSLGPDAKIIAGGTDLLADLKQDLLVAKHLISLNGIEDLKTIEARNDGIWIGAATCPNRLAESEVLHSSFPGLSDAAASMAGVQIRNLGTIGGNICSAVPSADLPPSLLTVDAELHLASNGHKRVLPLKEFFSGPRTTVIKDSEILEGILVPKLPENTGTAYFKFQLREASALAVTGAAARLTLKDNRIEKACVAISAAAPTPLIVQEAGEFLQGKDPSQENFEKAGDMAYEGVKPITDLRGSAEYRRELAKVLTVRALKKSLERIQS